MKNLDDDYKFPEINNTDALKRRIKYLKELDSPISVLKTELIVRQQELSEEQNLKCEMV
jgi:hypothetical protein